MIMTDPQERSELMWNCKKCGLLRSNMITHKHGEELPKEKLKDIERKEEEAKKREEERKSMVIE